MIDRYVHFSIAGALGEAVKQHATRKSFVLSNPCNGDRFKCSPYKITLSPGTYKMECWGSKGLYWGSGEAKSDPGKGAYT